MARYTKKPVDPSNLGTDPNSYTYVDGYGFTPPPPVITERRMLQFYANGLGFAVLFYFLLSGFVPVFAAAAVRAGLAGHPRLRRSGHRLLLHHPDGQSALLGHLPDHPLLCLCVAVPGPSAHRLSAAPLFPRFWRAELLCRAGGQRHRAGQLQPAHLAAGIGPIWTRTPASPSRKSPPCWP